MTKEKLIEKWFGAGETATANEVIALKVKFGEDIDKLINHYWSENVAKNISSNSVLVEKLPSLPLTFKPKKKLERGNVFLWRSGMTGRYEIHTFHSDAGYSIKTFTDYNEKDGSSMLVNWSGVCGVLEGNDL